LSERQAPAEDFDLIVNPEITPLLEAARERVRPRLAEKPYWMHKWSLSHH
jgi:hypothetical protein